MDNLQRELDEMWDKIFKTDRLELWEKYMEGAITPIIYMLYDHMRKLEMGGGVIEGVQSVPNDTPYL